MAVIKTGPVEWKSTRTGHVYGSFQAAQHYDGREARSESLEKDRFAEEAAQKLTPEEHLAILQLAAKQSDTELNRELTRSTIEDFFRENPQIVSDPGPQGVANGAAIKGSLAAQGLSAPYQREALQRTAEHLMDRGLLYLKPGTPKVQSTSANFDEEEAYAMPMEDLKARIRGW